ncbi:MAG: hypothetical protein ACF8R7_08455 [Phycisphaerales bacterium JB039]
MVSKYLAGACAASLLVTTVASADTVLLSGKLADHPDAQKDPPPYGLRFDNMYEETPLSGSVTGAPTKGAGPDVVTTFSFSNSASDVNILVKEIGAAGSGVITIRIWGTVYGGVDSGGVYGFGEGAYELDFTYSGPGVDPVSDGWAVTESTSVGSGTLKAKAGITGVADGTTWSFADKADGSGKSFLLREDLHRLGGYPAIAALDPYVGRGWLMPSSGMGVGGTRDFLFVVVPVPAPVALGLAGLAGVMGLGFVQRRRHR